MAKKRNQVRELRCPSCSVVTATIDANIKMYKATDSNGQEHIVPVGHRNNLEHSLSQQGIKLKSGWELLSPTQPIFPTLCEACNEVLEQNAQIVQDGGVFFKCDQCLDEGRQAFGVIPKGKLALGIRHSLNTEGSIPLDEPNQIKAYPPCAIAFTECSEHTLVKKSNDTPDE